MVSAGRPPSLDARIRRYFEDNPEEELTYHAMTIKFGVTKRTLFNAIYRLTEVGALESVHLVRLPAKGVASREGEKHASAQG